MSTPLAASLLTAIGVSICWLWVLRRFIAMAQAHVFRQDAIIRELHTDLIVERGLNGIRRRNRDEDPADWWKDSQ